LRKLHFRTRPTAPKSLRAAKKFAPGLTSILEYQFRYASAQNPDGTLDEAGAFWFFSNPASARRAFARLRAAAVSLPVVGSSWKLKSNSLAYTYPFFLNDANWRRDVRVAFNCWR
jgi:hypothetical protein